MKKYLIFNFKNTPVVIDNLDDIIKIYQDIYSKLKNKYLLVLIPSTLHVLLIKNKLPKSFLFGIQNIFWLDKITITGETTPKMVNNAGIKYVIIGHAERKKYLKEDFLIINNKIKTALSHKLIPILCVGEKEKSEENKISFGLKEQIFEELNYSLRGVNLKNEKLIIAYEPEWAIGSNLTPSLTKIDEVAKLIRFWLNRRFSEKQGNKIPIIYGGSVDHNNIRSILSLKTINGILIGSKSSNPKLIKKIINKLF